MPRMLFLAGLMLAAASIAQAEATLDWMVCVQNDGMHNAFTDLALWKGQYYLCFRHGGTHMTMDGEIRVMRSPDMKTWEPCGTLKTFGDDRDPHFAVTDDRLYVYFGTWDLRHDPGHGMPDRGAVRSHFATTEDGATWSKIQAVYEPPFWMWRVRHLNGAFYSAGYTACRPKPSARETRLLRSEDGLEWSLVSVVTTERMAGEADFWFDPDGSMWMLSRTGDEAGDAALFHSDASLTAWQRADTGTLVHSPATVLWKDRRFIAGRGKDGETSNTSLWELKGDKLELLLTLPSGGDTAYPGLLVNEASLAGDTPRLYISWYSQHETRDTRNAAAVYVGEIVVAPQK